MTRVFVSVVLNIHQISIADEPVSYTHLDCYTRQIWSYTSIIRQYYVDNLPIYFKQHFFQQISFGMWFKYHNKNLSINDKLKSFIVCVMGPKWVVGFQDLFTRNE